VVTLGEAMLRLSPPGRGRLERADSLDLHVAGSESNVAVALAALGFRARWVSRLPDSPLGRRVASELSRAGVDVDSVRWIPDGRVGVFFVEFGSAPRPTRVWYDRAGSAAAALEPADLDPAVLDGATYAVVSGITSALSPSAHLLARRFAAEARDRGATVCVDVNYREKLWPPERASVAVTELTRAADIVVCSARDARRLFAIEDTGEAGLAALRAACAPDARLLVLTRSLDGAAASTAAGRILEQEAVPTEVVDRIGAGDAFLAGLVWGLEQGDEEYALRAAAAAAALKCTIPGDQLVVTPEELRELVARNSSEDVIR
jgi:2-dehydro-3-deoxygluconokinase